MPSPKTGRASAGKKSAAKASARNTDSGPANLALEPDDLMSQRAVQTGELAAAMPFNPTKAVEHGFANGGQPPEGAHVSPPSDLPGASTLSEANRSSKVGTAAAPGTNPAASSLDRVRVDGGGQRLTTNQGVPIADNQNSLKYGVRGPVLLEDFELIRK